MANMVDYLAWRGDVPFEISPWNEIDGLLVATISYLNFHGGRDPKGWTLEEMSRIDLIQEGNTSTFAGRKTVFQAMASGARFRGCRLHHAIAMTDPEIGMQFSAMCLDLPDGSMCVAFRGTDNTVVGWREDFDMAYTTRVPAQEAAILYLRRAGMNRETSQSEGYLRIKDKIRSFIPQTSIIGLLMDFYEPYTVVRSTASGISQHDPMTWKIYGPQFETLSSVDQTAIVVRDTLHEWLQNSTPEQRADFVDALFGMVETTKVTRMSELTGEKLRTMMTMVGNRKEVDPETRRVFTRLMAQAVSLGFGNVIDWVRGRRENDIEGGWETMSAAKRREMLDAALNEPEPAEEAKEDQSREQKDP